MSRNLSSSGGLDSVIEGQASTSASSAAGGHGHGGQPPSSPQATRSIHSDHVQTPERLLAGSSAFKVKSRPRRMSLPISSKFLDPGVLLKRDSSRRSSIASVCSNSCNSTL